MRYRAIFLSDIHLGTRGCRANLLLHFLARHEAQTFYLVGDVFDGWSLRRGWHWPQGHNDVLQAFLAKAQAGAEIIFIPGNHDEVMRAYLSRIGRGVADAQPDGAQRLIGALNVRPRDPRHAGPGRVLRTSHPVSCEPSVAAPADLPPFRQCRQRRQQGGCVAPQPAAAQPPEDLAVGGSLREELH